MNNINQLDVQLLAGYIDNLGKDIVQQMLDLYIQQSDVYLQDIEQAISDESQTLWQDYCHKMKGATGSVGLVGMHSLLVSCEKSTESWAKKTEILKELSSLNQTAINQFREWLTAQ